MIKIIYAINLKSRSGDNLLCIKEKVDQSFSEAADGVETEIIRTANLTTELSM